MIHFGITLRKLQLRCNFLNRTTQKVHIDPNVCKDNICSALHCKYNLTTMLLFPLKTKLKYTMLLFY